MTPQEAREASSILRDVPDHGQPYELFIDTFHHPYLRFDHSFTMPGVTVTGIQAGEAGRIAEVLRELVPGLVKGCHILPEARPRKDSGQLQLARMIGIADALYLYIFKISAPYMGGALDDEIVKKAEQGVSPAVRTDRLYFHARLVPVEEVKMAEGHIVDFTSHQIREAIFEVTSKSVKRDQWSTVLFDEVDFSDVNQAFTDLFSHGSAWTGGRLFYPVVVDYLTLTLNLVFCELPFVERASGFFDRAFRTFVVDGNLAGLPQADRIFWQKYFKCWAAERSMSRGGNPHWHISRHPDTEWLQSIPIANDPQ